jgi:hypothetical protein
MIPPRVSARLGDSKEKTTVIPVETPEIDIGQPAETVKGGAAVADMRGPGGRDA